MNYKEYFIKNKLLTINDFFKFTQRQFKYGWMDKDANTHEGVNDAYSYSLQSPKELLKTKVGICWDMTELYRCFFENMTSLKQETYYLFYDDNKGCPSHSILVFYNNNKVYWFEPMFNDNVYYYSEIHEYDNIQKLLQDFKDAFLKSAILKNFIINNYDISNLKLYKYKRPHYHINGIEMRSHIEKSRKINIA